MPVTKLQEFLDRHHVPYLRISHSPAYTAQGIAAAAHISGKEVAKTVIADIDGALAMLVLPASLQVDLGRLKTAIGASQARLSTEAEFKDKFPDCETGAMPPFGNLYDIPVYVDESLTQDRDIAFNAGSHRDLFQLTYADFTRLVNPLVLKFAATKASKTAA